jgi:hypothetical protein
MSTGYKRTTKKYKILEQELIAKSNENDALMEELVALKRVRSAKELNKSSKLLGNPLMS